MKQLTVLKFEFGISGLLSYHCLGDLNSRHLFHNSEGWKFKIRVHTVKPLVKALFLNYRWLSSCCIFMWWSVEGETLRSRLIRAVIPLQASHPQDLNLITSPKPHIQI